MPKKPTIAYIDGDLALFPAASIAQTTWYVYKDENGNEVARFDSAAKGHTWIEEFDVFGFDTQFDYKGNVDKLVRSVEIEPGSFDDAKKTFENTIKKWTKRAGVDNYEVYVSKGSGLKNFRYDVAIRKPYKGNRVNSSKPVYLEDLRRWALTLPYVKKSIGGYETDDVVCAKAQKAGQKGLLIQNEKDGQQCVGCWVFYPDLHEEPLFSDPKRIGYVEHYNNKIVGLGWLFLLSQICTGDQADNYSGLDGFGVSKALNLLEPYSNKHVSKLPDAVKDVCQLYIDKYGYDWEITDKDNQKRVVTWFDLFEESTRLAYMVKNKKDYPHLILDVAKELVR